MKKNDIDKYKLFVLPVLSIGTILFLFFNFVFPKINEVFSLRKEIKKQNEKIKIYSAKANDLGSLSESELYSISELLLAALPANKDFYLALSGLQKIFASEDYKILSFQLNPGLIASSSGQINSEAKSKESFSVKLLFDGEKVKLANIVSKIESSLPILSIGNLKIESLSGASESANLRVKGEMVVDSYFSPLPQFLGKIEAPLPKMSEQQKTFVETLKSYSRYSTGEMVTATESVFVGKDNPFPY